MAFNALRCYDSRFYISGSFLSSELQDFTASGLLDISIWLFPFPCCFTGTSALCGKRPSPLFSSLFPAPPLLFLSSTNNSTTHRPPVHSTPTPPAPHILFQPTTPFNTSSLQGLPPVHHCVPTGPIPTRTDLEGLCSPHCCGHQSGPRHHLALPGHGNGFLHTFHSPLRLPPSLLSSPCYTSSQRDILQI